MYPATAGPPVWHPSRGVDQQIFDTLSVLTTGLIVIGVLWWLVRFLGRARPGLALGLPVAVAAGIRVLASAAIALTPAHRQLRGGDELYWLELGGEAARDGLGSSTALDLMTTELHAWVFAIPTALLDVPPEFSLRLIQIGIAVAGLALIAAAVHDLAGRTAGLIVIWILAFEPSNIFFSSILHKEPLLMLATGLVLIGGVRIWKSAELRGLIPMVAGCLLAVWTREYMGWFLIAGAAAIAFHGSLRDARTRGSSFVLAAVLAIGIAAAGPLVWNASNEDALPERLQASQAANAADSEANLALEEVDYSNRAGIVTNLPIRVRDILLRPYPWQVSNLSQQLAVLGSIVSVIALVMLIVYGARMRGRVMAVAGPVIYLGAVTLVAYSLSAGNAGTAFRYRTHILMLMIAAAIVLREHARERAAAADPAATPPHGGRQPRAAPA
jgi:hypothetical protein